ncbi:hypothetical protein CPB84DRAFT_1964394, partial [Gymnopilus junonius]
MVTVYGQPITVTSLLVNGRILYMAWCAALISDIICKDDLMFGNKGFQDNLNLGTAATGNAGDVNGIHGGPVGGVSAGQSATEPAVMSIVDSSPVKNTIENTYSDLSSKVPEAVEGLWKQVEGLGDDTVQFAHKILAENTDLGMDKIEELTSKIHGSINATRTFVGELQGALEKRGSDLTAFVTEFSEEIEKLSEISKLELSVPPLESREEHYERRNRQVAFVLNMTENALVKV